MAGGSKKFGADEHCGLARGKLGLAEEGRSSFEKINLRTSTNPASDTVHSVDGVVEKVDDAVERV
jgi:hypothetical protein